MKTLIFAPAADIPRSSQNARPRRGCGGDSGDNPGRKSGRFPKLREAVSIGIRIFGYIKDAVSVDPFRVHADNLHGVTGIVYVRLKRLREILQYRFCGGFLLPFHALKLSGRPFLLFLTVAFFPIACRLVFFKIPAVLPKAVMLRHIWFAEVITRTLCVPASAFNLP